MFLMAFIVLLSSFRRSRLGVAGAMGEAMLVDLRDRIINQGGGPPCRRAGGSSPRCARPAARRSPATSWSPRCRSPDRVEMAVVDVSGKGEQAGTRALMLSGAFGGLLGALPPEQFLPRANDYLLRQGWEEGFATAIHLSVDLRSGHLRGAQRRAPAGRAPGRGLGPVAHPGRAPGRSSG